MLEPFCLQAYRIRAIHVGPFGPFLAGYVSFLQQHRYTFQTIQCSIRSACAFSRWLDQKQIALERIGEEVLRKYRDQFRRRDVKPSLPTEVTGLPKLLTWLREQGLVALPAPPSQTEQEKWIVHFDQYLANVHGIAESTRSKYTACASRFMSNLFEGGAPDWGAVTASHIPAICRHRHQAAPYRTNRLCVEPQWSLQNRPTMVTSKPANGDGPGRCCSTSLGLDSASPF